MTWFKDGWDDEDVLSDELCQSLDFSKLPPPLKRWLIDEQAVRDRLGDIYEDILRNTRSSQGDPVSDERNAKLQRVAREATARNVIDQICALLGVTVRQAWELKGDSDGREDQGAA